MNRSIPVICPRCGKDVPTGDVNVIRMLAKCIACAKIFSFSDSPGLTSGASDSSGRLAPPRPAIVKEDNWGGNLRLSIKWFQIQMLFLLFFCISWDSFLIFWYFMAFSIPGSAKLIMLIFPLFHVAVGIGLTYFTLAGFINSSTLVVNRNSISLVHGPVPWWGNVSLPSDLIDQLYCRENKHYRKGSVTSTYSLHALLKNGARVDLITGQSDRDVVLYIEYAVEEFLGIADQAVSGELPDKK